jgi:hypothetical protein
MDFKHIKPARFALPKKPPKIVMVLDSAPPGPMKQRRRLNPKKPKTKPAPLEK